MDLNAVEGLTEEQIQEIYSDIVEMQDNSQISAGYWLITCYAGPRTGYTAYCWTPNSDTQGNLYTFVNLLPVNGYCVSRVCGYNYVSGHVSFFYNRVRQYPEYS